MTDGTETGFPIDPFAKYCLINGVDELGFLLQQDDAIASYERGLINAAVTEQG